MGGNGALAWRPIGPGDTGDWAGLLNVISAADRDWEYFTGQDLLEDFSDPYLDFDRGSLAAYDKGAMAGYGLLGCVTSMSRSSPPAGPGGTAASPPPC